MIGVSLLAVAVELVAGQSGPVLLVSISLRLQEALALEYQLLVLEIITESLDRNCVASIISVVEVVHLRVIL